MIHGEKSPCMITITMWKPSHEKVDYLKFVTSFKTNLHSSGQIYYFHLQETKKHKISKELGILGSIFVIL